MFAQLNGPARSPDRWISLFTEDDSGLDRYLAEEVYVRSDPAYLNDQKKRFVEAVTAHKEKFGDAPCFILRAPGRLNGFLEYLDMCAGDHMSTTIDGDIPLVLTVREDDAVCINNVLPLFPGRTFSISEELGRFKSAPWGEGASAGLEDTWDNRTRIHPYYGRKKGDHANYCIASFLRIAWDHPGHTFRGVNATFGRSTIPLRAGTSSSSAVVVLSAFSCLLANKETLPEMSIPKFCTLLGEAEWYVGTHGGANDQTTIVRNLPRGILYNRHSREPLESTQLPFLRGVRIVLANTLWEANKALGASYVFNLRKGWMDLGNDLLELIICFCGSAKDRAKAGWVRDLVRKQFGWEVEDCSDDLLDALPWEAVRDNYHYFGSLDEKLLGIPQAAIEQLITLLPAEIDPEKATEVFRKDRAALERDYTLPNEEDRVWRPRNAARFFNKENLIGRRLERLFLEAERKIEEGASPDSATYKEYHAKLGGFIERVQETIRDDFMVSNDQIELVLSIASKGPGHLGGKLTGAGCGGCVCIFVEEDKAPAMVEHLDRHYYGVGSGFDAYRTTLDELGDPAVQKEMRQNLDDALANVPLQRRIVSFSRGACVLDF